MSGRLKVGLKGMLFKTVVCSKILFRKNVYHIKTIHLIDIVMASIYEAFLLEGIDFRTNFNNDQVVLINKNDSLREDSNNLRTYFKFNSLTET